MHAQDAEFNYDTEKDLAVDRRQIPTQEKGSAERLGDRKGSGETNTGLSPHPDVMVTVQSVVVFIGFLIKPEGGTMLQLGPFVLVVVVQP